MTLFDAHNSRFQVPFVRYINNPSYGWDSCISLPDGTHKWQVEDSKGQNRIHKVEWLREKSKVSIISYSWHDLIVTTLGT